MDLKEILLSEDVVNTIKDNLDYLLTLIPEINDMIGFEQNHPHHHLDVWNHTLLALEKSKCDFDIRLTLLLHDIGKPFSYQDEEVRHFRKHPEKSSEMSRIILNRLGYDESYINYICSLIEHHDTPITMDEIKNNYVYCLTLYEIQRSDGLAHNPLKLEKRMAYLNDIESKLNIGREKK